MTTTGLGNVSYAGRHARSVVVIAAVLLPLLWASTAAAAELPEGLELSALRAIPLQHNGRWPPLDTVARDLVETVTGEMFYEGHDPVLLLLAWTCAPQAWMTEPLISIPNAELRRELQLSEEQSRYSYTELIHYAPLQELMDRLARRSSGGKLDALESKVGSIRDKLGALHSAFGGQTIHLIPMPDDRAGAWASVASLRAAESPVYMAAKDAWTHLEEAFIAHDGPAFQAAADELTETLAALPAVYRPVPQRIATELRFNRLRPFHVAWRIMVGGAVLAVVALVLRRRAIDVLAVVVMMTGFAVLTYGLSLRWQIAGRIPAANMYESLLFLSWGMGAFAILSMIAMHDRIVPLTASAMGALSLFLSDVLPLDHYIRPIPPVLMDTYWMSIHVPVIMVSYSVLALAMLIAHTQLVVMAAAPRRREWIVAIDTMHYWYLHVGSILLLAGVVTGSMWAASSWGRYWGWDPKEVWSLIALLAYLAILHVRVDRARVPFWAYVVALLMGAAVFALADSTLALRSFHSYLGMVGAVIAVAFFVLARGPLGTAMKSIIAFWAIIMTYLGVNYVLGSGLHSYGFGTGAVAYWMILFGAADLALVVLCAVVYYARNRRDTTPPLVGAVESG